jgi:outer membrane lipoprotein LolB
MTRLVGKAALAAMVLALGACAMQPARTVLPPLSADQRVRAEAAQAAREARLRDQSRWALSGRIAVSTGNKGGSGRIDWVQDGASYEVALSAPVTKQSWKLSGDPGWARLEGLEGGPREGQDARRLVLEATGWEIPVIALADWVRGLRSDALGAANLSYGHDRRLARMEQGGWTIDYTWREGADETMPYRLDAAREGAKVRLLIDSWEPAH